MILNEWLDSFVLRLQKGKQNRTSRRRTTRNCHIRQTEQLEARWVLAAPNPFDLGTLNGTNGFRLDGIDAGDLSGFSVSSAGDVNGDGFDDLIIGARRADPGGDSAAGESYVVFGKSSGFTAAVDLATLNGTDGFRLDGIDEFDYSGFSVSSAG
ncbi:MAG: integrin alpha, partial [Fuerstiella sp.]|nr:integrin alpha [Fuerstiella sp.]